MVTGSVQAAVKEVPQLTVLYDGACPLCRREIGIYRGLRPLRSLQSGGPVCFADVSDAALRLPSALPPGTTREQLMVRFHVRSRDGQLLSGAQAFLALWAALPGWRWLALAGRVPGAAWAMERMAVPALAADAAALGGSTGPVRPGPAQHSRQRTALIPTPSASEHTP